MSNPLKLHDLVALMSVTIGMNTHHTSRTNHIELSNVTGGILDYSEGKERTFPILDALASICVSESKSQVVAIGLQLQLNDSKLCLTLAENKKVKQSLVDYLHEVWGMLRTLSGIFRADRVGSGRPGPVFQYRKVSPRMPDGVASDARIGLFRHIYLYTRSKNQNRFEKWWDPLSEFMERFHKSRSTELVGIACDLDFAFLALQAAYKEYDCKVTVPQGDEFWECFYSLFEAATCIVTRITQENPFFCDVLVAQVGRLTYSSVNIF